MPRKGHVAKRTVLVDPIYNSKLIARLIDHLTVDDKKAKASSALYNTFSIIRDKIGKEPLEIFGEVMSNTMPVLEVRTHRTDGSNYQIPVEARPEGRTTLGLRWLTSYTCLRSEHTMGERLASGIIDASNNIGPAVKKREDVHRMIEANRVFTHYRF